MLYNKKKIFDQSKAAVVEHNLFFVQDVWAFLPCGKTWFYDAFPDGSEELNAIKELLEQNKMKTKSEIRKKLFAANKASELLALYRLIATPEEHQKLNQSYIDHTTKGKSLAEDQSNEWIKLFGENIEVK